MFSAGRSMWYGRADSAQQGKPVTARGRSITWSIVGCSAVCRCRTPKGRGGWSPCHDGHGREPAPIQPGGFAADAGRKCKCSAIF